MSKFWCVIFKLCGFYLKIGRLIHHNVLTVVVTVVGFFYCSKLQSDLKTTKFEETKIALEVCYNEIQRLRSEKLAPAKTTPRYLNVENYESPCHFATRVLLRLHTARCSTCSHNTEDVQQSLKRLTTKSEWNWTNSSDT